MHASVRGDGNRAMMSTERRKMLSGEMYDPLDPELVTARARARDLCQKSTPRAGGGSRTACAFCAICSARVVTRCGCSRRSICDYGTNIELGERVFFNFNCIVLDVCRGADRRLHALRASGADLYALASIQRRPTAAAKSLGSRSRLDRMCGSAAERSFSWRQHRLASRDRSRQRRDAGCPRRSIRCRQSVSSHPHDH